jgi:hypothetical protein
MTTDFTTAISLPRLPARQRLARSVTAATLAMASTVALVSCVGSSPEPRPTKQGRTTIHTATPTSTPNRPDLPDAARFKTVAGAKAFVTYYYELVAYGDKTHDWEPLKAVSMPDCTACESFWNPKPTRLLDPSMVDVEDADSITVTGGRANVGVVVTEVEERRSPREKYPPRWFDSNELIYEDGAWKVAMIKIIENGL